MENKDLYEANDLKEFNKIQLEWITGEINAIRNYLQSIEHEAKKGQREGIMHTPYIFEKTEKAKRSLEEIERRSELFNNPDHPL